MGKKRFVNYDVVKFQTKELIENSFIVTFFDSSAIALHFKFK